MIGMAGLLMVAGPSPYFPPPDAAAREGCPPLVVPASVGALARDADWLTRELAATGEISLYHLARTGEADVVRFVWIPTFHPTVRVRIEGLGSARPRLIAVQGNERGGRGSPGVGARVDRLLTADEVKAMRALLAPGTLFVPRRDNGVRMLDGAQWLIERVVGRCYSAAIEHSPDSSALRTAGEAMLRLTGWTIDPY